MRLPCRTTTDSVGPGPAKPGRRSTARPPPLPAFAPHAALAGAAGLGVLCEALLVKTGDGYWLALAAVCAAIALGFAWRRQTELRFAPVVAIGAVFHLAVVTAHVAGGVLGDQDPQAFGIYGSELLDGRYPEAEYPAGGILLFGLEALLGGGSAVTPNRLLMVPFQIMCIAGIWGLHTRYSRWLAAVLAIWPMSVFYWEYRFDLVPAGLLALGFLLAYRGRWGWSGAALGVGALVKWTPGVSVVFLVAWLLAGRRWRDLRRLVAAFVAVLLVHVPLLVWDADHVLNPYFDQGGREATNESVWYFPLRILGLTGGGEDREWAPTGAPPEADVAIVAIQVALIVGLLGAALLVRSSLRGGLAVAALAPALFLLTNRVFSPQFMLVVAVAILLACALTARDRTEQLLVGTLVMGATFANAYVYPYADSVLGLSWTPASACVYLLAIPAFGVVLRSALDQRRFAAIEAGESDEVPADFGFRDAATAISRGRDKGDGGVPPLPAWSSRALAWATGIVGRIFLVPAVFAAVVLPYRYWDSLAFGSWSRSIAEGRNLWDNASVFELSRPVVYVPQGLAWRYLDDGDWIGRLYSVSLAIALVIAIWMLAARLSSWDGAAPVARSIAVGVLLGSSVFAGLIAAGMTDIPVAAGSAATAAVLWHAPTRWLVLVVAALAAVTVLAKASGLLALAGLAVAVLILNGRRAVPGILGVGAGVGIALLYDAWQASRLGRSLTDFLSAGNEQYWLDRGAAARWDALARAEWLGRIGPPADRVRPRTRGRACGGGAATHRTGSRCCRRSSAVDRRTGRRRRACSAPVRRQCARPCRMARNRSCDQRCTFPRPRRPDRSPRVPGFARVARSDRGRMGMEPRRRGTAPRPHLAGLRAPDHRGSRGCLLRTGEATPRCVRRPGSRGAPHGGVERSVDRRTGADGLARASRPRLVGLDRALGGRELRLGSLLVRRRTRPRERRQLRPCRHE